MQTGLIKHDRNRFWLLMWVKVQFVNREADVRSGAVLGLVSILYSIAVFFLKQRGTQRWSSLLNTSLCRDSWRNVPPGRTRQIGAAGHEIGRHPGSSHNRRMGRLLAGSGRYRGWIARDRAPVSLHHFDHYGDGIRRDIGWQCHGKRR